MKHLVTQYNALNINDLVRGDWVYTSCRSDWVYKGAQETTVTITVLMDRLQLVFPMGVHRIQQSVLLTYTLGPQGGKRRWFVCPICQRRVGVLYQASGLPFRCRTCCDLVYPSQYRSRAKSCGRQSRMVSQRERDRLSTQCAGKT